MALPPLTIKARDDRGRPIRLDALGADSRDDPELADLQQQAQAFILPHRSPHRRLGAAEAKTIAVAVAAFLIVMVLSFTIAPGLLMWAAAFIGFAFPLVFMHVQRARAADRRSNLVELFLGSARCPACAYDLSHAPAGESEFAICSECSAAWRRGRLADAGSPSEREARRRQRKAISPRRLTLFNEPPFVVRDARGRALVIPDPRLRRRTPDVVDRLGPARAARLRRELRWIGAAPALCFALLALIHGFLVMPRTPALLRTASAFLNTLIEIGTRALGVFMVGLFLHVAWTHMVGHRFLRPDRIIQHFINRRICPHCIHPLEAGRLDDQRRLECRNCRALWRLDMNCLRCGEPLLGLDGDDTRRCPRCGNPTTR